MKDLTNSTVARQNILNNNYAIEEIQNAVGLHFVVFENQLWLTKAQLAMFFEIDERTIDRYIESDGDELRRNGYAILRGKQLKDFKLTIKKMDVDDINVVDKSIICANNNRLNYYTIQRSRFVLTYC